MVAIVLAYAQSAVGAILSLNKLWVNLSRFMYIIDKTTRKEAE